MRLYYFVLTQSRILTMKPHISKYEEEDVGVVVSAKRSREGNEGESSSET